MVVITDGLSGNGLAIIFIIIFASLLLYLFCTSSINKKEQKKLKDAKQLIQDGHAKILNGTTDDGCYREFVTSKDGTPTLETEKIKPVDDLDQTEEFSEWEDYWGSSGNAKKTKRRKF